MPYFDGTPGEVFHTAWPVPNPRAALVLVHGFGEHTGLYDRYAAHLAERSLALHALDQTGHGRTAGERGRVDSMADLVTDVRRLLAITRDELGPDVPIVLQGHSLGAAVATQTAVDDPAGLAGLVLTGAPLSRPEWLVVGGDDGEGEGGEQGDAETGTLSLELDDLSADPWYRQALVDDPYAFTEADTLGSLRAVLPTAWTTVEQRGSSLTLPVLLIGGELDTIAPWAAAQAAASVFPDHRTVGIPGGRHDILNDISHAEVATTIADFVLSLTEVTA